LRNGDSIDFITLKRNKPQEQNPVIEGQGFTYEEKRSQLAESDASSTGTKDTMVNPEFLPSPGDDNPFTSSSGRSSTKQFTDTSSPNDNITKNIHGYIDISLPSGNPNLRKQYENITPNFQTEHINDAIFAAEMSGPGIENPFQSSLPEKTNST